MMNLINIVPFFLVLSCVFSATSNKMINDKSPKGSLHRLDSAIQTSEKLQIDVETITITASYAAIECGCPQWFETKLKKHRFLNQVERFYVEPTNKKLVNADDLWDGETLPLTLKLVGRFSRGKEIPQKYNTKTTPEKARIFRYDKIINISKSKIGN